MEKAEENMEMLLKDVTERFETLAAQEAKKIMLSGSSDLSLYCDALWMSEAFGNVVKNALEHTKRGGRVVISWERTPLFTNPSGDDFRNQQGWPGQQVCLKFFPSYKRVRWDPCESKTHRVR